MSLSVNKVILMGYLGKEPEVRYFENGGVVANFSLATSESYTDQNTGEKREITDWHEIVAWRGLAQVAERLLFKGARVYVEGKLKKRALQDQEGVTKYQSEVWADELILLSKPEHANTPKDPYPKTYSEPLTEATEFLDQDDDLLPF